MRGGTARFVVAAAVLACVPLSACGGSPDQVSADCTNLVRLDGRVYEGRGYTDRAAAALGPVEQAACYDTGPDPQGSVFPQDPDLVQAWSFPRLAPDEVIAVKRQDGFEVFLADDLPAVRSSRIHRLLTGPDRVTLEDVSVAKQVLRRELAEPRQRDSVLTSATVTVAQDTVEQPNIGATCDSGRLLRLLLIGTFPRITTTGGPHASATDVGAVDLTADAESGAVCLVGVTTGQVEPDPEAFPLDVP